MLDTLFSGSMPWFSVPAILGTAVFVLRLALMLAGAGGLDIGGDVDLGDAHHADPTAGFKWISVQGAFAFMMGFGWGGIGARLGGGWDFPAAILAGLAGGAGMVWLLGILLKAVHDLQSSGNVVIDAALGLRGEVRTLVPAAGGGSGEVSVTVRDRQRTFQAVSAGGEIRPGARVVVEKVNGDHTVTVTPSA